MYVSPTAAKTKATVRMIATSFAAGAGLMLCIGLAASGAIKGALAVRAAEASTLEIREPLIQPLDVQAIQAQLEVAERYMDEARAETDDDVARLQRLTNR